MCKMYNRIENLCDKKNINITIMCNEIKMNRNILSNLKLGRSKSITSDKLLKIAKYFNVTTDYLLTGSEEKKLSENEKELLELFENFEERDQLKLIIILDNKVKNKEKF